MPQKLGKYEIVEKIGAGGFGVVYRAFDPHIKRTVAIKTCSVEDTETRARFQREAEIAGSLQHRNIVTVYEFGFDADTPFLVQEYLSGEDLDRKIKRHEYVPLPEKILWLVQIARGLEFAHGRGIVHRDIKPGNVRILDDGTAKLLDFGIARLAVQDTHLTQAGITLGTAAYLAPEQLRGQPLDGRSDVFSFGVLAYELLAYERPFRAAEISAIFYKILHEKPESLAARVPDLPVELDRIVARCLEKEPARRWGATSELVHALEQLMQRRGLGAITAVGTARAATAESPAAPRTAATARTPAAAPRLDELEFRHAEAPRVHSRSMATTAFGIAPRGWLRWLGAAVVAAALGVVVLWLARAGVIGSPPAAPPPASSAPAASPLATSPVEAPRAGPPTAAAMTPAAPAPEPAPTLPEPVSAPAPPPAVLVLGPAWNDAITARVGNRRVRLDRERRLELPAGSYTVAFALATPDYAFDETRKVRLREGQLERLAVPIERPGRLTVQPFLGSPAGTVRIDGRMAGSAPLRGRWLAPGEHFVELFAPGGAVPTLSRSVTVKSGVETVLTFDLDGRHETQVRERPAVGG